MQKQKAQKFFSKVLLMKSSKHDFISFTCMDRAIEDYCKKLHVGMQEPEPYR